ncbi:Protein of unknown function [Cotesia congregata]|uniref:Uncharacterized protein n=1 Tax=Cotesia congregata TaxID=51543 RepID=A0A8J2H3L3_COTCN|nr:Protein of unknown function [Cotesia congregata]
MSSNLKSVPPTVVAHDLSSLCDFKQIKKKKNEKLNLHLLARGAMGSTYFNYRLGFVITQNDTEANKKEMGSKSEIFWAIS